MTFCCAKCGRYYDDVNYDTICPHYPIGAPPGAYCKTHDLYRPCQICVEGTMNKPRQSPADSERYPL